MTEVEKSGSLMIRQSPKKQARTLSIVIGVFALFAIAGAVGVTARWPTIFALAVFGLVIVAGARGAFRARRPTTELILGPTGVTVPGHPEIGWTDLRCVRVAKLVPFGFKWGGDLNKIVAFIPQPGITLPSLQSVPQSRSMKDRGARQRIRRFQTPLVIVPSVMSVTTKELVASVSSFSQVTIEIR